MGIVRKQSIQASIFVYAGFAVGAFNLWLLPHILTTEQFGLVRVMLSSCIIFAGVCSLGTQEVITRFYPYFDEGGRKHKTDLLTWTSLAALIGFFLFVIATILFKHLIVRKFQGNAALFVQYFYLVYPFTFFILAYGILERVAMARQYTVLTSFLRESGVRIFTSIIVVALALYGLGFDGFMILYSLQYSVVFLVLVYYLFFKKGTAFQFKVSRKTQRLGKHMTAYGGYIFGGTIFILIAEYFNTILLGSHESLSTAGVFDISYSMAAFVLAPKRSMQTAALATIARAWKDRDMDRIARIYTKSAATLLISGLLVFGLIWLNLDDIYALYKPSYSAGKYVVFFVGLAFLTNMGTGLNREILINSRIWRIEFVSNVILVVGSLLLTYFMVEAYGMMGSAYAIFISLFTYNLSRAILLWWKYKIQPFSIKTIFIIIGALLAYFVVMLFLPDFTSIFVNIVLRSLVFSGIFGGIVLAGKLSDDVTELYGIVRKRF